MSMTQVKYRVQPLRDILFQAASISGDGLPRYMEGAPRLPLNRIMPMDSMASFAGAVTSQQGSVR
jgi:hypothetical protein